MPYNLSTFKLNSDKIKKKKEFMTTISEMTDYNKIKQYISDKDTTSES